MLSFQVVVLDMSSLAVLFSTESVSSSCSPVISVNWVECINTCSLVKSPKHSDSNMPINPTGQVMFFLTKDATLYMIDGGTGSMISSHPWHPKKKSVAISMYVIGKYNLKVEVNKSFVSLYLTFTNKFWNFIFIFFNRWQSFCTWLNRWKAAGGV